MTLPRASVVIAANDAGPTIGAQLASLAQQDASCGFEVIVVANRCTDDTAMVARRFSAVLDLRVLVADQRASAAYARNVGAGEAHGNYLLFCDADDRVSPNWVSEMVRAVSGGADFVGGRIDVDRSDLADWLYRWRYQNLDDKCIRSGPGGLPYALGASLGVRSEVFREVHGFDERFGGAGAEEVDLSRRLLRAGYRLGVAPTASVQYSPRTTLRAALKQVRAYHRGDLELADIEGRLPPCPPLSQMAVGVLKSVAHSAVREGERHPLALYGRAHERFDRWAEHRRRSRTASPPRDHVSSDFFVDVRAPVVGGLCFASSRAVDAEWYAAQGVEVSSLAVIRRMLPKGGVFVDVGAHVGLYSVAAALQVGDDGRVIAFEPVARSRELLQVNLARHGVSARVEVHASAAGATASRRPFHEYENSMVSGFSESPAVFSPGDVASHHLVEVVPLSNVVEPAADLLKIDVEGHELEVLEGARRLLDASPKVAVLFELNPAALSAAGYTPDGLLDFFPASDWELELLDDGDPVGRGMTLGLRDSGWRHRARGRPEWYANVLATRRVL